MDSDLEQEPLFLRDVNTNYQYVHTTDDNPPQKRNNVVYLLFFISFLSSFCFSVTIPSMWLYMDFIGASVVYLGWAVAAHSTGTMLVSPILLFWARKRPLREILICSLLLMVVGNVLYSQACCMHVSPTGKITLLLAARFLVGAAAGVQAVATAYLSHMSRTKPNERIMLHNGIAVIGGYIIGPALATTFSLVDIWIGPSNSFTSPGYATALLALVAILPCSMWVVNKHPPPPQIVSNRNSVSSPKQNSVASMFGGNGFSGYGFVNSVSYSGLGSVEDISWQTFITTKRYKLPVASFVVCFLTYFSLTASFVVWETIGSFLTNKYLKWGVVHNSILFTCIGVVSIMALWILKLLTHIIADKLILVASAVIAGSGAAVLITPLAWSPIPFSVAVFLVSLGTPLCVKITLQLFDSVLEMNPELPPSLLVWLSCCGSVARIFGALGTALVYKFTGPGVGVVFILVAIPPFLSALVALCCFYRLPV